MLKRICILLVLVTALLAGCGVRGEPEAPPTPEVPTAAPSSPPASAPPTAPGSVDVNVVDAAGLRSAVRVEIEPLQAIGRQPIAAPVTVGDGAEIRELVQALDEPLALVVAPECPPMYALRFTLGDGQVVAFHYACPERAGHLRGDQALFQGRAVQPSMEFDRLIGEHLSRTEASLNAVEAAGLRDAVAVVIRPLRSLGPEGSEPVGGPAGGTEPIPITEPGLVAEMVAELDDDLPLRPRAQCAPLYALGFVRSDGETVEFEYACGEGPIVLRGEQAFFDGRDVHPSLQFDELIASRLGSPTVAVNVVALTGLAEAEAIHILERAPEGDGQDYVERSVIDDAATVEAIVAALAGERELLPPADCHAHYELRFSLPGGSEVVLGHSCAADGGGFVRGEAAFFEGQDAAVPPEFDRLLLEAIR